MQSSVHVWVIGRCKRMFVMTRSIVISFFDSTFAIGVLCIAGSMLNIKSPLSDTMRSVHICRETIQAREEFEFRSI